MCAPRASEESFGKTNRKFVLVTMRHGCRTGTTVILWEAQEAGASWVSFLLLTFLWTNKEKWGLRQANKNQILRKLIPNRGIYFASWRVTFLCVAKEKLPKERQPKSFVFPARFRELPSFRCDIRVASSLKRTSCAFSGNFPPMLGELIWALRCD